MPNQCGLFYCRCGLAVVECGGERYTITSGDMYAYIPSTLVRLVTMTPETEGMLVEADVDYLLPVVRKVVSVPHILHLRSHPSFRLTPEQRRRFEALLHPLAMVGTLPSGEGLMTQGIAVEQQRYMGYALCLEVLQSYFANQPIAVLPTNREEVIFHKFMTTLFRCYRREREVAYYATQQHLTPRYFSAAIKGCSGESASHWIAQMVMSEAQLLLEGSEMIIKEIAPALRVSDQSAFWRYFKQNTDISPSDYRGNIAGNKQ